MSELSLSHQKLCRCKGKDILVRNTKAWIQLVELSMNEGIHQSGCRIRTMRIAIPKHIMHATITVTNHLLMIKGSWCMALGTVRSQYADRPLSGWSFGGTRGGYLIHWLPKPLPLRGCTEGRWAGTFVHRKGMSMKHEEDLHWLPSSWSCIRLQLCVSYLVHWLPFKKTCTWQPPDILFPAQVRIVNYYRCIGFRHVASQVLQVDDTGSALL